MSVVVEITLSCFQEIQWMCFETRQSIPVTILLTEESAVCGQAFKLKQDDEHL